jgi:hypothetical protein
MSARSEHVRALPCIACQIEGIQQPAPTEEHHLNLGGKAGQKRRGDDYSIPLCAWHHRGDPAKGMTADLTTYTYGPSLARSSKLFRFTYGSDDQLLALTNLKLKEVA